ncbi:MAG: MFS transporter [bacterium]|nr:MFS transporter [bacterium]
MPSQTNRRSVFSWCLYDFANSAFTTLIVTFVYAMYYSKAFAPDEVTGMAWWSRGIAVSSIFIALLSPFLGAMADQGARKVYLFATTTISILGCAALYWITPGHAFLALACFVIANIAYELACGLYNAYLPDIATEKTIGRVSGYGWALGYGGGLLAMFAALVLFIYPETPWFGFAKENGEAIRASCLLVAVWYALFSIPMFLWVKDRPLAQPSAATSIRKSFTQLKTTFAEIRKYRPVVQFLAARLIFNDGLVTIFAFGSIYAAGSFAFSTNEIMIFGIIVNVAAGLGAFGLGFLDDYLGAKRTIQISLVGLIVASALAILTHQKMGLYLAGVLIGIFAGPTQSASRSLMGRLVPPEKENEFFGFFTFSGKATAFLGPTLVGLFAEQFQSQRAGLSVVVVFFIVGGILLHFVPEKMGKTMAENLSGQS